MLNRFKALSFRNKIMITSASLLILFLIPVIAITFILRKTNTPPENTPPIQFEYCGTSLKELCILSFGRDGAGQAILNFHVPDRKFPAFYLIIKSAGAEHRYECKKSTDIKTSVFCSGEPLSLRQTVEISILANEDDRLLATGTFFIEAFLVSPQGTQAITAAAGQTTVSSTAPATASPVTETTAYPDPAYSYP